VIKTGRKGDKRKSNKDRQEGEIGREKAIKTGRKGRREKAIKTGRKGDKKRKYRQRQAGKRDRKRKGDKDMQERKIREKGEKDMQKSQGDKKTVAE
jgi:hypothetical protein